MERCLFCSIVKGEIDSAKIYEDEDVFSFLDINPVSKGHALVIPKKHFENVFDIDEAILQKVMVAGKTIAQKIKNQLKADGIRLSQSNGAAAGQAIFHFHLHIIPRYKNDGISMSDVITAHPPGADFGELKKLAIQLKI